MLDSITTVHKPIAYAEALKRSLLYVDPKCIDVSLGIKSVDICGSKPSGSVWAKLHNTLYHSTCF